ncbi:MAG TPA: hypothetical protein GX702_02830 [Chloroflexi bacterium]|jgi:hypothetical protein|nr:hypothetical protein [Chloroflexota bacterium]
MQIRRDFAIHLSQDTFVQMHGARLASLLDTPSRRAILLEVLEEAQASLSPAAAWDRFAVTEIRHDRLILVGGRSLGGGPVARVMYGAEELVVAVCTAGAEIDARVAEYQRRRELFRAMLLDELGSWAVDQVRQMLCRSLEDEFDVQGWRTSTPLSPGESAWSVAEQRILFDLLDAARIGVTLSEGAMMRPTKSLSFIMGVGRRPLGAEGRSGCEFCSMKERCLYREQREKSIQS